MRQLRSVTILFFLFQFIFFRGAFAQIKPSVKPVNRYAETDKKALAMPDSLTHTTEGIASYVRGNFQHSPEKARAIFIWIATNIQYDLANMFALNFYEKKEEKISKPLLTRKGICENYAALFQDICSKVGIKAFVVEGYTKQNGFADYIPHAWCAALIDTSWLLFDPTWGSGYVNNSKFVQRINEGYFMASPAVLIKSHMPFDYLWQFLYYPVTNQEFYEGKTAENRTKAFFNFRDSIAAYEKQDLTDYYIVSAVRIEKNGVKNSLIYDRLQHIRREVEIDQQNKAIEKQNQNVYLYNAAISDFNKSINSFNAFINYRNNKFMPMTTDDRIQAMLDTCAGSLKVVSAKLSGIREPDTNTATMTAGFHKQVDDLQGRVDEQQDWLKKYFAKGKSGRKGMFTKYTWFGIPMN